MTTATATGDTMITPYSLQNSGRIANIQVPSDRGTEQKRKSPNALVFLSASETFEPKEGINFTPATMFTGHVQKPEGVSSRYI